MQTLLGKHWHNLPPKDILQILESDSQQGLDIFEIQHRQARFGRNSITPKKRRNPFLKLLMQFNNPLVFILLAASLITAYFKDILDALIIFGVVVINAIIGFIQEARAEKAIDALANSLNSEATVIRSGKTQRVDAAELVPGDLVLLKSGDRVPADLRLIRTRDLEIEEAALTGESLPVKKSAESELTEDTILAERRNIAYASTLVKYGQGTGVVTATGDYTEIGRISQLISSTRELATPLTRKISQFSQLILYAVLALASITFLIGVLRGQAVIDTFTAAIALAVAMIPEGLPAALTVTLAIGVSRMARRRAIIRRLPAVEALGSTTIICTDKTGTLTQNQMTVQQIIVPGGRYSVSGVGFEPYGEILPAQDQPEEKETLNLRETLLASLLCNDSALEQQGEEWIAHGDPTEVALIASAWKNGLKPEEVYAQHPRVDAIPFESEHQYMATLHRTAQDNIHSIYVKGSVETILEACKEALDSGGHIIPLNTSTILNDAGELARGGLRVLAFARRQLHPDQLDTPGHLSHADILGKLTFLGLQGMIDPPRPEAIAAVQACQDAGIEVKMITGDHALTAAAIARQIGLDGLQQKDMHSLLVLTGKEMAAMSDKELIEMAEQTTVFARVSPEQKLRLVEALQAQGNIVAMTGDGVNDGPALKQADIGIAMGISGTEVAKEAADMVLADDNFASIQAAIEEGRGIFDNLTKIIAWTLPTNIGEGLVILLALISGVVLPILPIQILWINMTSVGILGIVLALEPKETGIMERPPRDPKAPILTPELIWRILLVGFLILAGVFGLFEWELTHGASLAQSRTVAVNAVITIATFYLLNCRSLVQSVFRQGLFSNQWVWLGFIMMAVLQLAFTYIPFMNKILASAPISADAWLRILAVGLVSFLVIEFEKWVRRRPAFKGAASQDKTPISPQMPT